MPATYSINIGEITESTRKKDIFDVLSDLPNNTQKLITPRDVRDAFLSTWANSTFKITSGSASTIEYIGVDSNNPDDRDVKQKILLGKRSFGNLNVMNSTLLNSDTDIFFYNTKNDGIDQRSTKISILAGTNSSLFKDAPYIEANSGTSSIDLNIKNPYEFGGEINIQSFTGSVAINGIVFPTILDTSINAQNGKILKYSGTYPYGSLKWDDPSVSLSQIGNPGTITNIYGDVSLNGHSLEFIDPSLVPVDIGGITAGSSFPTHSFGLSQSWPLTEIIRKILYPYIEPVLELSVTNNATGTRYVESGTSPVLSFSSSITTYSREPSEDISSFVFIKDSMDPSNKVYPIDSSFGGVNPGSKTHSYFTYTQSSQLMNTTINYGIWASTTTSVVPWVSGYSFSATQSITWVNPIFYGFSNNILSNPLTTTNLSKSIQPIVASGSYELSYDSATASYFYFIYPTSGLGAASLDQIHDPNELIIYDSYVTQSVSFTHSQSNHSNSNYVGSFEVYRTINKVSYNQGGKFKFIIK